MNIRAIAAISAGLVNSQMIADSRRLAINRKIIGGIRLEIVKMIAGELNSQMIIAVREITGGLAIRTMRRQITEGLRMNAMRR